MPIDTLDFAFDPAMFAHTLGSPDVTVLRAGRYRMVAQPSIDHGPNNSRTSSAVALFVNLLLAGGPLSFGYHRNRANGEDTIPVDQIRDLAAGDVVRAAAVRIAGIGPLNYVGFASRLSITQIEDG